MTDILKKELCLYLGQLMYYHEKEVDWILKDEIGEKINAVNKLVGIDSKKQTWYEKLAKELKEVDNDARV
jgi:hypothetical protein